MNREALTQLVRVLHTVHSRGLASNFSLELWVADDLPLPGIDVRASLGDDPLGIPHACGTTACACGYAGLDDWFRARGFCTLACGGLNFDGWPSWKAVKMFFGLDQYEAEYLFSMVYTADDEPDCTHEGPNSLVGTIQRVEQFLIDGIMWGAEGAQNWPIATDCTL